MSVLELSAQSFVVKGRVTSADEGEGMISLTVMQKGTGHGVVTDFDGNYRIELNGVKEATLVFTYVGYAAQEHVVICSGSITTSRVLVEAFTTCSCAA